MHQRHPRAHTEAVDEESLLPWSLTFSPEPRLTCTVDFDPGSGFLTATLSNPGEAPLIPGVVRLQAALEAGATGGSMWIHGRYMQQDALVRCFGAPPEEGYDGYRRPGGSGTSYLSREVTTLTLPSRPMPALLIGCVQPGRFFVDIAAGLDSGETRLQSLTISWDLEATSLAPGESLTLPAVLLLEGRDPWALMEQYARVVAEEMHARVPGQVPTGWCSWYYFYNRVSEADIRANLADMMRERHPAEFVQIDDGFQAATGDWLTPNEKFPSGMAALAAEIAAAGYRPGLWLAPFLLHEDAAALREHPELVLRTHASEPYMVDTWLGRCAVLDCTLPAAETWLRSTIRTVVRDWGYTYLKLDACAYAAAPATHVRYAHAGTTAPMNLRRGLEIIRDEAGEDVFLLGCTCHFGPAIGLVDAMRVGPDVKELWADGPNPSVRHAMRLALQRNWMHRRWWVNDPDCVIVRDTDTQLSEAEVKFLVTGIALSGGMVVASDDLPRLPEERRALARKLFPPVGIAARPGDPAEGPVASAWRADLGEGRFLVGLLNWSDEPVWVVEAEQLRPGEIAFDALHGRLLGKGDVLLRPHEGALWQVTGAGKGPRVVGDSGHLNYAGLFQRPVSGRIQVRNDGSTPRTIAIEARRQLFEVTLAPGESRWFD